MTNYFRITAYNPKEDISIIADTNGLFDKVWKFSAHLVTLGFNIVEVSNSDVFLDGNIDRAEENKQKILLRSYHKGEPVKTPYISNGKTYQALQVDSLVYVPNR